jgi:hypothetical protein
LYNENSSSIQNGFFIVLLNEYVIVAVELDGVPGGLHSLCFETGALIEPLRTAPKAPNSSNIRLSHVYIWRPIIKMGEKVKKTLTYDPTAAI